MAKEGRPTKYLPTFIKTVDKYLKETQDVYTEFHKIRSNSDKSADGYDRLVEVKLPTVEDFASYINVSKNTLYEWAKLYPEFQDALEKIVLEQRKRLERGGLSGDYNSTIAKLILSANHGLREKSDVTSDGKALPTPILGNVSKNDSNE